MFQGKDPGRGWGPGGPNTYPQTPEDEAHEATGSASAASTLSGQSKELKTCLRSRASRGMEASSSANGKESAWATYTLRPHWAHGSMDLYMRRTQGLHACAPCAHTQSRDSTTGGLIKMN